MRLVALLALTILGVVGYSVAEEDYLDKFYNVEADYLGCYKDDKIPYHQMDRALTYPVRNFFGTKIHCVHSCAKRFFRYAALQNGYLCFCGNGFNKYGRVDDRFCNVKCRDNQIDASHLGRTKNGEFWKVCGGRWANSVYSAYGLLKQEHLAQEKKMDDSWLFSKKK